MTQKSWEDWMPRDGLGFIGRVVFQAFRVAAVRSGSQQIPTGNQSTLSCWRSRKASHVWENFVSGHRKLVAMALLTNFLPMHFQQSCSSELQELCQKEVKAGRACSAGEIPAWTQQTLGAFASLSALACFNWTRLESKSTFQNAQIILKASYNTFLHNPPSLNITKFILDIKPSNWFVVTVNSVRSWNEIQAADTLPASK